MHFKHGTLPHRKSSLVMIETIGYTKWLGWVLKPWCKIVSYYKIILNGCGGIFFLVLSYWLNDTFTWGPKDKLIPQHIYKTKMPTQLNLICDHDGFITSS